MRGGGTLSVRSRSLCPRLFVSLIARQVVPVRILCIDSLVAVSHPASGLDPQATHMGRHYDDNLGKSPFDSSDVRPV